MHDPGCLLVPDGDCAAQGAGPSPLGDAEAARVVHEAIGQLLGLPVAPER
ncbi:hypothetical protein [Sorangium sp. So ce542]